MAALDNGELAAPRDSADDDRSVGAAYDSCRKATKQAATNFYYAIRTLPSAKRRAIYATYAFCRLCDDIVDEPASGRDPATRLAAVREGIDATYEGRPDGDIWLALNDASVRFAIRRHHFHDIVDGVEMDLTRTRYETFEDLRRYCLRVACAVGLICIEVCGYEEDLAEQYASDLGIAMQLTNILRDINEDARNDRVYIPQEDLRRFNYTEDELRAGVLNDRFRALMAFQTARAGRYFESGSRLFPLLDRRSRACPETMYAVYTNILNRIERAGYDIFSRRVSLSRRSKLAFAAKLWLRSYIPALP